MWIPCIFLGISLKVHSFSDLVELFYFCVLIYFVPVIGRISFQACYSFHSCKKKKTTTLGFLLIGSDPQSVFIFTSKKGYFSPQRNKLVITYLRQFMIFFLFSIYSLKPTSLALLYLENCRAFLMNWLY